MKYIERRLLRMQAAQPASRIWLLAAILALAPLLDAPRVEAACNLVPGTAKTLLARALAHSLDASFKRIQFSPDMMPADVVGTNVGDPVEGRFTGTFVAIAEP